MEPLHSPIFNFVIADDDPDDQYALQKVIWDNNQQHKITSVFNGMQLLEYLLRTGTYKNCSEPAPDCIFLDVNMPLINGYEVLEKIRSTKSLRHLKVHVVTSSSCKEEKEKLLQMGADGFFTKHPDVENLKIIFRNIIMDMIQAKSS
jgi:two-component system response regulator